MKSSFFRAHSVLPRALTLGALALAGCGGGTSAQKPQPTATPGPTPTPTAPPVSLLNTIVFVSNRDGGNDIYSMSRDGSAQTRLTTSGANDQQPARARDGSRVVFSSDRAGNPEIYTMGIQGETSNLLRLTTDSGASAPSDTSPDFSADGSKIAWVSTRGGASNVWTMDSTGANQNQFTTEGNVSSPAFSPDGSEIAYSVTRPLSGTAGGASSAVIVTQKIATGTERIIAQGNFDALSPRYAPNGSQIVFTQRDLGASTERLRLVNLASGAITDGPGTGASSNASPNLAASFSPDGTQLVFETASSPSPQIGVSTSLSGAGIAILTSQGQNAQPSWGQ